nr:MAG TPA: hypothetical protein [Caudoviricetes sp.]
MPSRTIRIALRRDASLLNQRDVQPFFCISATAVPWMV